MADEISEMVQEKVLVEWTPPERPFKKRNKEFYVTLVSIVGLLGAILFIIEGIMPVIFLASLVFLFYVLSTVPPKQTECKITDKGVWFAGRFTDWHAFGRFWFTERWGVELLVFETFSIPGRMEIVVDQSLKPKIEETIKKYLKHEEIPPSVMDKLASFVSSKFPQSK